MEYEYLLRRYTTVTFRPACRQEVPLSIRGFSLPSEYIEFISQHDGASLVFDASVPDLDDMRHIELFSLREIIDGTSYQDPYYESEEGQRAFSEWKKNQQHDDNEMNNERMIENTDNFVS